MSVGFIAGSFVVGFLVGFIIVSIVKSSVIKKAKEEAERIKKEKLLEVKEELQKEREEIEKESKKVRKELIYQQEKLSKKLEFMDRKERELENKLHHIERKEKELLRKENDLNREKSEIESKKNDYIKLLERVANLSQEEAKKILLKEIKDKVQDEIKEYVSRIEEEARVSAEDKAKEIIASSIQRLSSDYVAELTTVQVSLPNEDMKGRIIGREGRNIRAFESATGVEVIVDDTPEVITLSSFDGVRREIAKISLERLISDGRIHPARIEDVVNKVKKEVERKIVELGDKVVYDMGIEKVHPEIRKLIGRLKYRYSYGQNILNHSIEVANIASNIASELGVDVAIAKRAALLHDIGKGVDESVDGSHAKIGAEIAKRYGEKDVIVQAILSHHEEVPLKTVFDYIVYSSDAISASRPGARMESVDRYIKRIEKIEEIANSFNGVEKAYALQAGREIRVLVNSDIVSDIEAGNLAKEIAKKIENEVEYPGQVKVLVIRELRREELAK